MYGVLPDNKLLRHKSNDARCTLHQLGNSCSGVFIRRAQFFFGIILGDILQTEKPDRHILPSDLIPVCYFLVENIFYLSRCQLSNLIIFIQCQYISLFNHPAVEQSQRLGKEKQDDKHNGNACYETTASQYTFYYFFKKFLHKYLLIFCMQRNGADVKRV